MPTDSHLLIFIVRCLSTDGNRRLWTTLSGRNCEWEEGGLMVPWWAVIIGLVAGIVIGFIIIALISANDEQ